MNNEEDSLYPRRLQLKNGSLTVVIPPQIYKALGWASGNWVTLRLDQEEVRISRAYLNPNNEAASKHHLVPKGKHGRRFRQENAALNSQRWDDDH